jgi:Protein of unknown function (DUF732)
MASTRTSVAGLGALLLAAPVIFMSVSAAPSARADCTGAATAGNQVCGDGCSGGLFGNPGNGTGFTSSGGFAPSGPCPAEARDSDFLSRLAQAGMTPNGGGGALGMISIARHICDDMQQGAAAGAVVANIQTQVPDMSHGQIVALVDAAHSVYCPTS